MINDFHPLLLESDRIYLDYCHLYFSQSRNVKAQALPFCLFFNYSVKFRILTHESENSGVFVQIHSVAIRTLDVM